MTARRYSALLATATVAAATLFVPSVASAHGNHHPDPQPATLSEPIAQGLVGPLQIAVDGRTVYIAQSFAGVLTKVTNQGSTDIVSNPGGEISGIAVKGKSVFYTAGSGELASHFGSGGQRGASVVTYESSFWIDEPRAAAVCGGWPTLLLGTSELGLSNTWRSGGEVAALDDWSHARPGFHGLWVESGDGDRHRQRRGHA